MWPKSDPCDSHMIQLPARFRLLRNLPALAALLVMTTGGALSDTRAPEPFTVANTATLTRSDSGVAIVPTGFEQRLVHISVCEQDTELVIDAGASMRLWRIPTGLSRIEWQLESECRSTLGPLAQGWAWLAERRKLHTTSPKVEGEALIPVSCLCV